MDDSPSPPLLSSSSCTEASRGSTFYASICPSRSLPAGMCRHTITSRISHLALALALARMGIQSTLVAAMGAVSDLSMISHGVSSQLPCLSFVPPRASESFSVQNARFSAAPYVLVEKGGRPPCSKTGLPRHIPCSKRIAMLPLYSISSVLRTTQLVVATLFYYYGVLIASFASLPVYRCTP